MWAGHTLRAFAAVVTKHVIEPGMTYVVIRELFRRASASVTMSRSGFPGPEGRVMLWQS